MSLNIKNPEADRLVTALSDLTGESKTQAVVEALRERLRRHDFTDHGDLLYDERGLPG